MTISVVTGGSGFIGSHLVERLLARGERVRILDLEPPAVASTGATFIQGSVTDRKTVRSACEGARHVYHAAAIPHLWVPEPASFQLVNVDGTRNVLDAAVEAGIGRVVHVSSATVLMDRQVGRHAVVVDERHQTAEKDLYGDYARSKWRAERLALSYRDRVPVVVVMPTLPLGPGDRNLTPPTRMLLNFVNGRNPAFVDCLLDIIDVRDVASGLVAACRRGRAGERYVLGQHGVAMATFLELLEDVTGRSMPRRRIPTAAALVASVADEAWSRLVSGRAPRAPLAGTRMSLLPIRFDNGRARAELDLPFTRLRETLADAVAWLAGTDHVASDPGRPALALGQQRSH